MKILAWLVVVGAVLALMVLTLWWVPFLGEDDYPYSSRGAQ